MAKFRGKRSKALVRAKRIQQIPKIEKPNYKEYINVKTGEVVTGKQAKKLSKKPSSDYLPTVSYVQSIEEQISELPDVITVSTDEVEASISNLPDYRYFKGGVSIDVMEMKSVLINALYDTLYEYESEQEYEEYLAKVYPEIQHNLTIITRDSDEQEVRGAFSKALELIQKKAMSPSQSRSVSEYEDALSYSEIEDIEE